MVAQCTPHVGIVVAKLAIVIPTPALEIVGTEDGAGVIKSERDLFGREVITEVDSGQIITHFA